MTFSRKRQLDVENLNIPNDGNGGVDMLSRDDPGEGAIAGTVNVQIFVGD